jgi:hypothetical protein
MSWVAEVRYPAGEGIFSFSPPRPGRVWGLPSLLPNEHGGGEFPSPGIKRPGREADHFPLAPRLRIRGAMPSFPSTCLLDE